MVTRIKKITRPKKKQVVWAGGVKSLHHKVSTKTIRIKLVKSAIGASHYQKAILRGLGLRRRNSEVERKDTTAVRGMINKMIHLLQYEIRE